MRKEFRIKSAMGGSSLLQVVRESQHTSGKQAKKLIDDRDVLVNGKRVWMAKHVLNTGDIVSLPDTPKKRRGTLKRLFEDRSFLIIDKPAGILSVGELSAHTMLQAEFSGSMIEPVHRLDKDTSGCLAFARTQNARDALIGLFKARAVGKDYRAIVAGRVPWESRTINTPIDHKPARSVVRVLARGAEASYLHVSIETGRTHQIRRHLCDTGFPIIGDRHYFKGAAGAHLEIPRQMLHAFTLAFKLEGDGSQIHARAPIPEDFKKSLRILKINPR